MKTRKQANRERGQRHTAVSARGWNLMRETCPADGKRCYATRGDAKRAARQRHGKERARAYKCGEWWHLTSQDAETVTRYREGDMPP